MTQINISHAITVEVDVSRAWSFLWDIEALARCIRGCTRVATVESQRNYEATVERSIGPFALQVDLRMSVVSVDPPRLVELEITGKDRRLKTRIYQTLSLSLRAEGQDRAHIAIEGVGTVTGVLASVGKVLIRSHIDEIVDEFAEGLRREIKASRRCSVS